MENIKKSFGEIWSELTEEQSEYLKNYINKQRKEAVNHYKSEQLILHDVSQQRELLEAYTKQIKEDNEFTKEITFQDINKCIASNCG